MSLIWAKLRQLRRMLVGTGLTPRTPTNSPKNARINGAYSAVGTRLAPVRKWWHMYTKQAGVDRLHAFGQGPALSLQKPLLRPIHALVGVNGFTPAATIAMCARQRPPDNERKPLLRPIHALVGVNGLTPVQETGARLYQTGHNVPFRHFRTGASPVPTTFLVN